ncbi:hypothetical protein [Mycoplasma sp. 3686d]|uniref:hypothetical protein n=1 Tax=Mycoplasma sp. 3686d TaxID=2967300 RepID=UPI00211C88D6|nr:hypothetical protein [Mycoplasma sp. 3686d]UUM25062.1 hypothetical protein NPA12_01465 [Mycoplasma sp. 3686d]
MKNPKKVLTYLGMTTGVTAGASLGAVGVLLSLHNTSQVPRQQKYYFMELKNQINKTSNALKLLSQKQQNNDKIKNLSSEVDYANQLLRNENASIALMLEQRNKLKKETPKALLSVVSDLDQAKNLINEYCSLVKDVDLQNAISASKDKVVNQLSFEQNKVSALNSFFQVVDPIIAQENDFLITLETKIWTNHKRLIQDSSSKFSTKEKSALLSTIDQILNLLAEPNYSKDSLIEYEKVYDQMVDKLSLIKEQENKLLNKFLENVIRVTNEVSDLDIDRSIINNFLQRIEHYKTVATSPWPTLAIDKSEEIAYLNTLVNNQLEILIKKTPDTNKLLQTLSQSLENLKSVSNDLQLQNLVNLQVRKIASNPKSSHVQILKIIAQASDLSITIKNIEKLIDTIKTKINVHLADKNLSQSENEAFKSRLDDIIGSNFDHIDQYLTELNSLYNDIYDNVLLGSLFKNSLKKLNDQIEESLNKGFNLDKRTLTQMSLEVSDFFKSNPSIKDLNQFLVKQIDKLRKINRAELKNWYNLSLSILEQNDEIDSKIKDKLKFLNSQAITLIPQNSTAIREDLQNLIKQYRSEFDKTNISKELSNALVKYSQTKDAIFEVFANDKKQIDSSFGNALLAQVEELSKQAKIIASNPSLSASDKEKTFMQIEKQLKLIEQNVSIFKNLEPQISSAEATLATSKNRKAEQRYLQEQADKINQVKAVIFQALKQISSDHNLSDLTQQINQAINDYKEKQAQYQGGVFLTETKKQINQLFNPYSLGGAPTKMQQRILNQLNSYQTQLSSSSISTEKRKEMNDQVSSILEVANSIIQLELEHNALENLVSENDAKDYSKFKPNAHFTSAKSLIAKSNKYIDSFLTSQLNENKIQTQVKELKDKNHELSLAISLAFLQKTNAQIQELKTNDSSLISTDPYKQINSSIEKINTQIEKVISDNNKTIDQIEQLEESLKNYLKLAEILKTFIDRLKTIKQSDNPITYNVLVNSIINKPNSGTLNEPKNTLINFGDSLSVVEFKVSILKDQLSKVSARINAENEVKKLEKIYGQDERNRTIFDDSIKIFDNKLSDYKIKIADFYASNANLLSLSDEIDFYQKSQLVHKSEIEKTWNDVIDLKSNLQSEYNQKKVSDGLNTSKHTDAVFTDFDALKDSKDNSGKNTTSINQLEEKLEQLDLAYQQDSLLYASSELKSKINSSDNYSNNVKQYSNSWKSVINNWNNAIEQTVDSYKEVSDLTKIKQDFQKISALNSLIDQIKTILDYSEKQKTNVNVLDKFKIQNTYASFKASDFYNQSSQSIIALRDELRNLYFDNISIEDAKSIQKEKINAYKTLIDSKLESLKNNIDNNLKTQIDTKLQELLSSINTVKDKNELIQIDNELSSIQLKDQILRQLANTTHKAQSLVKNNNIPTGKASNESIINLITSIYNSYKDEYLSLSPLEINSKEKQINDKIALFNKFSKIYTQVTKAQSDLESKYLKDNKTDIKSKMNEYFDVLIVDLNKEIPTMNKLFEVENTLNSLNKLITLQAEKLQIQNQVFNENTSYNDTYSGAQKTDYGFKDDAQNLAKAILNSVPSKSQDATDIDAILYPTLIKEFENAYDLYKVRKKALDQIYKNSNLSSEQGIKNKEFAKLSSNDNADQKYNELKDRGEKFFHTQAQEIAKAQNITQINNAISSVSEIDVFFDKYKRIAELIDSTKSLKTSANGLIQNDNVKASLDMLNEQIIKGQNYYYNEKNNANLDQNISSLETYTFRLNVAIQVANKQNELTNFNSNEGDEQYLGTQAKVPLENILNQVFQELKVSSLLETKDNYERLLEKYVSGVSNHSYAIALINSKILQTNIHKAQQYLKSYKTKISANSKYESAKIQVLYSNLENKINQALQVLHNPIHNESEKIKLASELYNSNDGALDLILKAQRDKSKHAYQTHLNLDRFIANNFSNSTNSPKLNDYSDVALNPLNSIDLSTPEKLEEFNDKLIKAQEKYQDQRVALFKWEANRYNSYKEKFEQFYNFLNTENTDGASKNLILETTGITQNDLDNFNSVINPTSGDKVYVNAREYAQKVNQDDQKIKSWLKEFEQNDVINSLTTVANELSNYYLNLISIKSIPSILIKITNLNKIKDELNDNSSQNQSQNVRSAIKVIDSQNTLNNKINEFINLLSNVSQNDIKSDANENNISFSNSKDDNTKSQRNQYFEKYKSIVISLAKAKEKLMDLVFGTSNSEPNTLSKILSKFIKGIENFAGIANIDNILKFIIDKKQKTENSDEFNVVKTEYDKLAKPSLESVEELNNLSSSKASDFDIYKSITKGFDLAFKLFNWTKDSKNTNLFFDFLNQSKSGKANYQDIVAKDNTTLEKFKRTIEDQGIPEEDLNIDGVNCKAKKINQHMKDDEQGKLGSLFNCFNILKCDNPVFDTENIDVFVYKSALDIESKYVSSHLTAKPEIKKGFINLYFRFKKPSSLSKENSAFGEIDNFGIKFENVGISFKTLDTFEITKENIKDTNALSQTLFTAEEAGWNNLQASSRLFSAFNKHSLVKGIKDKTSFYTEKIDEDINAQTSQISNSSPEFRIKVKLTGKYKEYTQFGEKIYWRTLNPNFVSDTGLQHQNTEKYLEGLIKKADRDDWESKYQYKYDASKDKDKNLLFLPFVIGIPMEKDGEKVLMVISWQILNRFDKNRSNTQNISLGNEEKLRNIFFFKRTTNGQKEDQTKEDEKFFQYVIEHIRYRDLVALSFKNLVNSGLWKNDSNIEVIDNISGNGGVGTSDFYNAIGESGFFNIKFKLH